MTGVPVWFYGDYGCPFSYLADRRLELLARERPIDVRWRPLALYPEARRIRARGLGVERAAAENGIQGPASRTPGSANAGSHPESVSLHGELRRAAEELDLPLALPPPAVDTREALQAAEFARDLGGSPFRRLHRALFRTLFGEGRDLGSRSVLLELAGEAGVDPTALEAALDDRRYESALEESRAEASAYGIEATPGLLFGRFLLIGAAPLDELRHAADRAERERGRAGRVGREDAGSG